MYDVLIVLALIVVGLGIIWWVCREKTDNPFEEETERKSIDIEDD